VTGAAKRIRDNARNRLRRQLGVECDAHKDFLIRDEQGYHLSECITVARPSEEAVEGTPQNVPSTHVPASGIPPTPVNVPASDVPATGSALNERQGWILSGLKKGALIRRSMVVEHFGVADKTAKRDLADLKTRGPVEYVRGGHYRSPQP